MLRVTPKTNRQSAPLGQTPGARGAEASEHRQLASLAPHKESQVDGAPGTELLEAQLGGSRGSCYMPGPRLLMRTATQSGEGAAGHENGRHWTQGHRLALAEHRLASRPGGAANHPVCSGPAASWHSQKDSPPLSSRRGHADG